MYYSSSGKPVLYGTAPVYFTSADSEIPYVRLSEIINVPFFKSCAGSLFDALSLTVSYKGNDVVLTNEATKETMEVDTKNEQFVFSDYDRFFCSSSKMACNELVSPRKYIDSSVLLDNAVGSFTVSYGKYDLPVYTGLVDGNPEVLLPFKTLCDLTKSSILQKIGYNGKDLYIASYENMITTDSQTYQQSLNDYGKQYFDNGFSTRNAELIDFNYKELVFNLDLNYGLKERQGITSFDQSLQGWGLKESLYSDSVASSKAVCNLVYRYLGDLHSSYGCMTPFSEEFQTLKSDGISPSDRQWSITNTELKTERTKAFTAAGYAEGAYPGFQIKEATYTNYANVQQSGVTAFITFDEFTDDSTMDHSIAYLLTKKELIETNFAASGIDTIGLVVYANYAIRQWDKEHPDKPVKNVVVDLSCNGGGSLNAGAFLSAWLIGYCPYSTQDSVTGSKSTVYYYADANMDGTFQTRENEAYKDSNYAEGSHKEQHDAFYLDTVLDKNIFVLVSESSFSCANTVPFVVKTSRRGTLIGAWSGGGACSVMNASTADGTLFNLSGPRRLCYESNGSFVDLDNGVDVDYKLSKNSDYFDRDAIVSMINNRILIKSLDEE